MRRMLVDWSRENGDVDFKPALNRFENHLRKIGLKDNTILLYRRLINNYLTELNTNLPMPEDAERFYESLHQRRLSRSTINNFAAAIIKYQDMISKPVKIPFLKLNNALPYYFDEIDILKIFDVCYNFKHLCMLMTMFFGCLRSGELCNLDIEDYNPGNLTLKLRATKNGSDDIAYVNDETARNLNRYLQIRPALVIDGREPLFYTDFYNRWSSSDINRMFLNYKKLAGIEKKGSTHCFSRHSSATLLISRGCDLRTVQGLLRHRDINTTLRYAHLNDKITREKHEKFLKL